MTVSKCPVTHLTMNNGAPVADNQNSLTAGARGPLLAQDLWLNEKLADFVREVIPERRMHAKGSGAFGTFTVTHDITKYTRAKIFSEVGKQTEMFARFTTVAGERGAADAERDIRGFALKFYTEEGNWDMVGNNTPVFFLRDPRKFPDLNKAVKRDPRTNMRSATNNWDFWTLLPEAELHSKSWTSPPTHKVQFFYEQIYITLQIPSRTPLPAYTQPTAYRRSLRHLPNPPATMDTYLSRRRHRRTRTSPIQNHD